MRVLVFCFMGGTFFLWLLLLSSGGLSPSIHVTENMHLGMSPIRLARNCRIRATTSCRKKPYRQFPGSTSLFALLGPSLGVRFELPAVAWFPLPRAMFSESKKHGGSRGAKTREIETPGEGNTETRAGRQKAPENTEERGTRRHWK